VAIHIPPVLLIFDDRIDLRPVLLLLSHP
jgi:hypothetical protein